MLSRRLSVLITALAISVATLVANPASAQDQVYFSSNTNVTNILVNYINHETVRLDISSWYLSEHSISIAIANRFAAGVPVRIIGDRGSMFEADPHTKTEFYWLANQGIPIRLRFNPSWFPEINHWKMAIFVGQNRLEFGSGNFAPTELAPVCAQGATNCSPPNYDDDSELFTTDPTLVGAFETKFDVMWNDTTKEPESIIGAPPYLKDWNDACANEPTGNCADYHTLYPNPAPMVINTARLEPDNPMPADLYWGQGPDFNNRLIQEINKETAHVDIVVYRLEVGNLAQALIDKFNAGVALRVLIDPDQYTSNIWPEYWLSHAYIDKLFAAGIPVKQRTHPGVTHMKTLITSAYATNASSNFGPNWQRDHDYFISAANSPTIYQAFVNDFNAMWADTTNYGPLVTTPPNAVDTGASGTVPSPGQSGVGVTTSFVWNTASWATSYDIYLGTSSSAMTLVANVAAQLVTNPPTTYSWTPPSPLNFGTTYSWKVVSRTFANMTASSSVQSFSTPASGSQPPTVPSAPSPASGAAGGGTSPTLTWTSAGATSYAVNFGTTNPPPSTGTSTSSLSYTPATLASNTTYYWQIVASNGAGSTPGPIWSFATSASNLPSPWQSQDVGATGQAGSSIFGSGTYTIRGAGADVWGTADAFQFGYQPMTGDGTIIARVASAQNTSSSAKAAVMMRASVAANAANVILDVSPTGNIEFMSRATSGGSTSWLSGGTHAVPVWLKLVRTGSTIVGSTSTDGTTWTQIGSTTLSLPSTIDSGLAVCSHDTTTLNTSTFDNVSIVSGSSVPGTPSTPLPASGATAVSTSSTLSWTSSGATTFDVAFGTTNPPPSVSMGQSAASYSPGTTTLGTTYFWQIIAHNAAGTTAGPMWSFTTTTGAPPPPVAPGNSSPGSAATGVSTSPTLTWTSSGATTYDVAFGTSNPPPSVTTGQSAASYTPGTLTNGTTYVWQITAHNAAGTTSGPIWSFTTAAGSTLPSPWQNHDVGAVGTAGSATFSAGQFTVSGAGADIWGSADAFQFVYQPVGGDGQIVTRVVGLQNTNANAKAGVMFRESLDPAAAHVMLDVQPSGNIEFMTRATDGAQTSWLSGATQTPPLFLRLIRAGTTVTGAISTDGQTWTTVGSTTITLPAVADVGVIVSSHNSSMLNTATFDSTAATSTGGVAPAAPAGPSPTSGAAGVSTTPALTWSASGATSYDVAFGTSNPPPTVSSAQSFASFSPSGGLNNNTTYFWQVVAHNSSGSTAGPIWTFMTAAPAPPGTPGGPNPLTSATGVSTTPTLTWSASGATSYDVKFGATNPPSMVSSGQASASFSPSAALSISTTYFWQIVANNSNGSTPSPIWSFTTTAVAPPTDIVIYASDIPSSALHGIWSAGSAATSPNGIKLVTPDNGTANTNAPLASPADYVDVTFTANAGVPYTLWLRVQALNNNKSNDSLWVQFSDAQVSGSPIYPLNSTSGLDVNLATDTTGASDQGWGWVNGGYWLSQPATLTFASSGTHTLRVQVREDGVQFDQIVLSPSRYLNAGASCPTSCTGAPGGVSNDSTIVSKP